MTRERLRTSPASGIHQAAKREAPERARPVVRDVVVEHDDGTPSGLQGLQSAAGNQAVGGLVKKMSLQRQGNGEGPSASARPTLRFGARGENVGILQQKLNAARAASPSLVIDGLFGPKTRAAVVAFQIANGLRGDGVVGATTWTALDAAHPGGGRDASGAEVPVASPDEANPVAVPVAGSSLHPAVGTGFTTSGPAVEECQQKLNNAGATPPITVTGTVDAATTNAIRQFQTRQGLTPANGVADAATWQALDLAGRGSTVGRVERDWRETVGGRGNIGMTSKYTWRLLPTERPERIEVTVNVGFTGLPPKLPQWFNHVRTAWNKFAAVNTVTGDVIDIVFNPQQATGGGDNTVNVAQGPGRANAGQWFLIDNDEANTIAHEWGHLVGLQDEYQQTAADYERTTGSVAVVGATGPGAGNASAGQIAAELARAVRGNGATGVPGTDALAVIQAHQLQQGAFAQQVAAQYRIRTGRNFVDDVLALDDPNEFFIVDPFFYSSSSTMGDPGNHPSVNVHEHGVQPRHVREFVGYIRDWASQAGAPDAWEVHEQGLAATIASTLARLRRILTGAPAPAPTGAGVGGP